MKADINLPNILAYITGNYRYKLYYSKYFQFLIRKHIKEQIDFRIKFMDKDCYEKGSCVICGCETTALQMADKPCDKPCYPPIFTKHNWEMFQLGSMFYIGKYRWNMTPQGNLFFQNLTTGYFTVYKPVNNVEG